MASLLIVEDDPALLAAMKDLLTIEEHHVRAVNSALAALEAVEADRPELIIADMSMPEMTGLQLLEAVRDRASWSKIPFLFVSASILPESETQIATLDGVFYLRKPFEIESYGKLWHRRWKLAPGKQARDEWYPLCCILTRGFPVAANMPDSSVLRWNRLIKQSPGDSRPYKP